MNIRASKPGFSFKRVLYWAKESSSCSKKLIVFRISKRIRIILINRLLKGSLSFNEKAFEYYSRASGTTSLTNKYESFEARLQQEASII
jgi:hypothetical protein